MALRTCLQKPSTIQSRLVFSNVKTYICSSHTLNNNTPPADDSVAPAWNYFSQSTCVCAKHMTHVTVDSKVALGLAEFISTEKACTSCIYARLLIRCQPNFLVAELSIINDDAQNHQLSGGLKKSAKVVRLTNPGSHPNTRTVSHLPTNNKRVFGGQMHTGRWHKKCTSPEGPVSVTLA